MSTRPRFNVASLLSVYCLYLLFLNLSAPRAALGQTISIGLTAGSNLTKDFRSISFPPTLYGSTFAFSDFRSFIAGPSIEVELRNGLSAEVNALHRSLRFTDVTILSGGSKVNSVDFTVGTWEFPILAKYQLSALPARPFLELGPSFRAVSNPNGSSPSNHGITVGAGATVQVGVMKIAPVLRYTRWARDAEPPKGLNFPARPTINNQLELLMNISYGSAAQSRRGFGKKLWVGVVAGAGLTGDFRTSGATSQAGVPKGGITSPVSLDVSGEKSHPVGVKLEVSLTDHLSVEGEGLYRRLHFKELPDVVLTWEIPLLLKYRFAARRMTPFLAAGPSFRPTGNLNDTNPSHYGAAAEAGVEKILGRLKIEPELRYTHWASDRTPTSQFQNNSFPRTVPNQVEALLSVSF